MTHGIYKGDCIELMQRIDNDTIDCCITDPPYGVNFQSSHRTESLPKILNDEAPFVDWIPIVFQKLKLGGGAYMLLPMGRSRRISECARFCWFFRKKSDCMGQDGARDGRP